MIGIGECVLHMFQISFVCFGAEVELNKQSVEGVIEN